MARASVAVQAKAENTATRMPSAPDRAAVPEVRAEALEWVVVRVAGGWGAAGDRVVEVLAADRVEVGRFVAAAAVVVEAVEGGAKPPMEWTPR